MTEQKSSERLVSLDAFRGATIALMILVNDPGNGAHVYRPLEHAEWHGWTITDVVFPSFLWIVGVAITLSLGKKLAVGASKTQILSQALRRAAILFGLGLLVYAVPDFNPSTFRILGVLQRIAICYFLASAIYLTTGLRGQILWIIGLLSSYWLIMAYAPVPGFGAGRLDVEGNFSHYIDSMVLGAHNYSQTKTWDPEGIISTLPSLATTLLGIMAGHILRIRKDLAERTTWLFLAGNLLIAAGLVCDTWLPINKKLWTTSFALFMGGLDFVLLAICVWLIDARGYKRFARPFVILGMNAIAIYMVAELFQTALDTFHAGKLTLRAWIYQNLCAPLASPMNASLIYAVAFTLLMFGVSYVMYRRGWFLRV